MASLDLLPIELLHIILVQLDPIGLVSVSQSCSRLRCIVCPGKKQLIERLLALECLAEHGGGAPSLSVRDQCLEPTYPSPAWEDYRWACTGCLRLRSHIHFDNRSLLRLGSRKPTAGSKAGRPLTTWKPSLYGKTWGRQARKPMSQEERDLRQRYRVAIHQYEVFNPPMLWRWTAQDLRRIGMQGFEDIDDEQFSQMEKEEKDVIFDRNIRAIELIRCGSRRHARKCNECRFQGGQLRAHDLVLSRGTSITPILPSRQLRFSSPNDRHFPGLSEHLGIESPPCTLPIGELSTVNHVFVMQPTRTTSSRIWTMYMVRCPGCERWQEMRAFRIGEYSVWWKPKIGAESWDGERLDTDFLDTMRCHSCFARDYGTAELGRVVCGFVKHIVFEYSQRYLEGQLCWGWFALKRVVSKLPSKYRKQLRHLLRNVNGRMMRSWNGEDFTFIDVAILKLHHGEFGGLWREMIYDETEAVDELRRDYWFETWVVRFGEIEAMWFWTNAYTARAAENPELVAEWALGRYGTSLI